MFDLESKAYCKAQNIQSSGSCYFILLLMDYYLNTTTVAICGGGACGLAVLLCLLEEVKKAKRSYHIFLFEKHSRIGPGLAYSKGCGNAIINMRADTMGLYASDPLHFTRWVRSNRPEFGENQYPPRHVYRDYLSSLFDSATHDAASQSISLDVIHQEIVEAVRRDDAFQLSDDCGQCWIVDKAVLALGNFPHCFQQGLTRQRGYFASPWPLSQLDQIPPTSNVCIVGSRLSGVDAAFHLTENGHKGVIYIASRGVDFPRFRDDGFPTPIHTSMHCTFWQGTWKSFAIHPVHFEHYLKN